MRKKWYRLDTAALIFPAIARRNWRNAFRFAATLTEPIDPEILKKAVSDMKPRFPSFFVSLQRGLFWYYLEESNEDVPVFQDFAYPLTLMSGKDLRKNCLRILYHENRIAVEIFHSVTDGMGGRVFLQNLVARYLELKYGIDIPHEEQILDIDETPSPEELEDSFLKHTAETALNERDPHTYMLHGEPEPDGFLNLIMGIVNTDQLLKVSRSYGVSLTSFLAGVMIQSIIEIQNQEQPIRKRQKPVKVMIPVDLRTLYGSKTLRNFVLVLNMGVDPRYGEHSLEEICKIVYHQLCASNTPQYMAAKIAANVLPQRNTLIRLAPVFLKNSIMDMVYERRGEKCGCLNITNVKEIRLPEIMRPYVTRMEMILGTQRSMPNNCAVLSYNGKTYISMIRNIRSAELERRFFSHLVELGVAVDIESNRR